MKFDLSDAAAADLQAIANYTLENWGPEQEEEYLGGIWKLLQQIASRPEGCRIRPEFGKMYRSAKYRRHVIFFVAGSERTQVVRVLHGAMDFGSHLPDDLL